MLPASIVAEFKSAHGRYAALDDQSMESPNGSLQKPVRAKKLFLERCIWSAWSAFLLSVLIWIIASTKACVSRGINATPSTYEAGFDTDLVAAVPYIRTTTKRFTGGIVRDANGELYLNHSGTVYVGRPSREVDEAWHNYEAAIELHLDSVETKTKSGMIVETMQDGSPSWYRVSLDVIHSLHCVNQLRKAVYAKHYYSGKQDDFWYMHMDHCIDHLRQSIECHSDLTPLPYSWNAARKSGTPIWTQEHTCRDFDSILAWDNSRLAQPLSSVPNHP